MDKLKNLLPDRIENISVFILILLLTFFVNYIAQRTFNRFMRRHAHDINLDMTNYKFLGNALQAIIIGVGLIFAIREYPPLRTVAGSLLAGAGILAAIVGFASQAAFSNIVNGIFIIIFKPFRVNDRLKIKDIYTGIVEDITLRHTVIRDFENRRIIVPNSVIASEILVNSDYNEDAVCRFVEFNVVFSTDLAKAKRLMAEEIGRHPKYFDRRTDEVKANGVPLVEVRIIRVTDWSMVIRGNAWGRNATESYELYCDSLENVKNRFHTEEVEIALPHQIVSIKK